MPDRTPRESPGLGASGLARVAPALLMLYAAPLLAGAAGADVLSIPIFAALFAMAAVAQGAPTEALSRRLVQAGAVNLLIVAGLFTAGRFLVWTGLIPQAPVELWLTLGMAAVATLLLRRLWANHRTAQFAAEALAEITGSGNIGSGITGTRIGGADGARAAWGGPLHNPAQAIAFELDRFADGLGADMSPDGAPMPEAVSDEALEDLVRALVRIEPEAAVAAALLEQAGQGEIWRAAFLTWIAYPGVTGKGLSPEQVADHVLQGLASPSLRTRAARGGMVWAGHQGFGAETAAVRAAVRAHLAAPLPLVPDAGYLRPCLEELDRNLGQ